VIILDIIVHIIGVGWGIIHIVIGVGERDTNEYTLIRLTNNAAEMTMTERSAHAKRNRGRKIQHSINRGNSHPHRKTAIIVEGEPRKLGKVLCQWHIVVQIVKPSVIRLV